MQIHTLFGGFDRNLTYVVELADHAAVLIDAGIEAKTTLAFLAERELTLQMVFITHPHGDHTWALGDVVAGTGTRVAVYESVNENGLGAGNVVRLHDGQDLNIAETCFTALFTPGHQPDHMCIYVPEHGALFTGDVLFIGRTGRTVSAGADTATLYASLRDKILPLPDDVVLYPGHDYGPVRSRSLGEEKAVNPFLQATDCGKFVEIMAKFEATR